MCTGFKVARTETMERTITCATVSPYTGLLGLQIQFNISSNHLLSITFSEETNTLGKYYDGAIYPSDISERQTRMSNSTFYRQWVKVDLLVLISSESK